MIGRYLYGHIDHLTLGVVAGDNTQGVYTTCHFIFTGSFPGVTTHTTFTILLRPLELKKKKKEFFQIFSETDVDLFY